MTVTVERAGTDEATFADVFGLLVELHREGGFAPLNFDKATASVYRVLVEGMTFVARTETGEAIGVLGLTEAPFWYADETMLEGKWLYVRPEHRGSAAFKELLKAARAEADACGKIAFLIVDNPDRRPKRTASAIDAQLLGYVGIGYAKRISRRVSPHG